MITGGVYAHGNKKMLETHGCNVCQLTGSIFHTLSRTTTSTACQHQSKFDRGILGYFCPVLTEVWGLSNI